MIMIPDGYYVYMYLRVDGRPYYVGKGIRDRVLRSGINHRPPRDHSRIRIVPMPDEFMAWAHEKYLIRLWGRKDLGTGCLNNRSDGGLGGALTGEALEKMKNSRKGQRFSEERKAAQSRALKGRPKTAEHVMKVSIALKGRKPSQKTIEAAIKHNTGRKQNPETIACRVRGLKKWYASMTPEQKRIRYARISASNRGQTRSSESRKRMSVAAKDRPWSAVRRAAFARSKQ